MAALNRFSSNFNHVRELLAKNDFAALRLLLADYQAPDIAASFEDLEHEERLKILRNLEIEQAVDIFECLHQELQLELMREFKQDRAVRFLEEMEPDDRTDLIQSLPAEVAQQLFEKLPAEEREEVRELIQYKRESAGGIMTTDFARLPRSSTVAEALEIVRREYRDLEMTYVLYVLEDDEKLVGEVTLHDLLLAEPGDSVENIMQAHPMRVTHDTDQEVVAREILQYDQLAMPVVDFRDRMLGIITFDDVGDVLDEEATEDQERFGGVLGAEESYERSGTWTLMKQRLPWLMILLLVSSLAGFVIEHYAPQFNKDLYILLTMFFPMVTATAGNAGTQAATIIVRGIATGEIDYRGIRLVLTKELLAGLAMGLVLALLAFGRVFLFEGGKYQLAVSLIAASSILVILMFSTLFGSLLPMIVRRMGFDPATMSSPLITTTIDTLTAVIYFNMALLLCLWLKVEPVVAQAGAAALK